MFNGKARAMSRSFLTPFRLILALVVALSACAPATERPEQYTDPTHPSNLDTENTVWSILGASRREQTVKVNRYLWEASLDTLNFLPLESVDPFTGLIVTGYGTPPGGGRAYRATIHITDPALDARSLRVSMQTRSGPVSPATTRAVEDAILSRARQLRIADSRF